jgi:His-Xaa-Ser system protein HxsD
VTASPEYIIHVDESVFPLEVVIKATYWLSGKCSARLERDGVGMILVSISNPERPLSSQESADLETRFRRDLIDFRTRAIIESETRTVRDILVAKAFASGDEW